VLCREPKPVVIGRVPLRAGGRGGDPGPGQPRAHPRRPTQRPGPAGRADLDCKQCDRRRDRTGGRGPSTAASWRWIFVVNLPIGIATVIAAARWVPNIKNNQETRIPDLIGSLLLIVGLGAVSLGLVKGPDWGWGDAKVIACWAAALAGIGLFLLRTRLARVPVVDLAMFKSRVFSTANVAVVIVAAVLAIQLLGMSLFLEQSWHWSTVATGLGIAPEPVMVYVGSQVGQRLNRRFPVGSVASAGFAVIGIGIAMIAVTLHHVHSYPAAVLPGWLLSGFGTGLTLPTIIGSGTADLPPEASATGSAVVNMARQLGYSLGTATLVAILGTAALSDPRAGSSIRCGSQSARAAQAPSSPSGSPRDNAASCQSQPSPHRRQRPTAPHRNATIQTLDVKAAGGEIKRGSPE
jgi:hypothetical protein